MTPTAMNQGSVLVRAFVSACGALMLLALSGLAVDAFWGLELLRFRGSGNLPGAGLAVVLLLFVAIGTHLLVTLAAALLRSRLGRKPMGWPAYWACALLGAQAFNIFMLDRWDPQVAVSVGGASLVLATLALGRPERGVLRAMIGPLVAAGAFTAILFACSWSRERARILQARIDLAIDSGHVEELKSLREEGRFDPDSNLGHAWCRALNAFQPAVLDYFARVDARTPSWCGKRAMASTLEDTTRSEVHERASLEAATYAAWRGHPEIARATAARVDSDDIRVMMSWAFHAAWRTRRLDFPRRFAADAKLVAPGKSLDAALLLGDRLSLLSTQLFRQGSRDDVEYTRWVLGHFDPSDVLVAVASEALLDRVREWLSKPGIDPNRRSYCGLTALGAAMQSLGYQPDLAKPSTDDVELTLLAHGANPDAVTGTRYCDTNKPAAQRESYTPLSLAATVVYDKPRIEQVARALLKAGANPDLASPGGLSFRQAAARSQEPWVRKLASELESSGGRAR